MSKWKQIAEEFDSGAVPASGGGSRWAKEAAAIQPEPVVTPEKNNLTWTEALKSAAINSPRSAYKYAETIYDAVAHPVETAKGVASLAASASDMVMSRTGIPLPVGVEHKGKGYIKSPYAKPERGKRNLEPIINNLKQSYGSVEGFKHYLAQDPVGVMADVSSLFLPASKVAGVGKLTKTAKTFKVVSEVTEPVALAYKMAAVPFKLIPDKIPSRMYQSAVKWGTTIPTDKINKITNTALINQVMPTIDGMKKLRGKIDGYNAKVTSLINQSMRKNTKVPLGELYRGLNPIIEQMKKTTDQPLEVTKAFNKMKTEWKAAFKEGYFRTPEEVQKIKQRIYKDLESYYEKQKASPAKVELRKAVARNARESLEKIIPEIKQLNKNEGALIELWDAVESKANRITNRDFISIGLPIKMGAGGAIGYMVGKEAGASIGTAGGFVLGVYDTPQVKAKLALVLSKLKRDGIKVRQTALGARLGLYQYGKERDSYHRRDKRR